MAAKIFIIGSCVSRDAFRLPNRYKIAEYVARTSLASAFETELFPISDELIDQSLTSEFQKRLVRWDTRKQLENLLDHTQYDAILIDFIDERFDIIVMDNSVATLSNELAITKIQRSNGIAFEKSLDAARLVRWRKGLDRLLRIAVDKDVPIFVNRAKWAEDDLNGVPFNPSLVRRGNETLTRLYSEVGSSLIPLDYQADLFRCDPGHIWGRTPFHYAPAFYERTLAQLDKLLE